MGASEQPDDFIGIRANSPRRRRAPPTGAIRTVSIYVAAAKARRYCGRGDRGEVYEIASIGGLRHL